MPRKRYYKRRYKRRGYGISKLRRQVKAIASNAELKYIDHDAQTLDADSLTTGGQLQCLNVCQRNVGPNDRVGEVTKMKRLSIRGYWDNGAQGTSEDVIIRMIVFRCKFQNNAAQTYNFLMQDSDSINSLRRMEHKARYKVYFDQTFTMKATSETAVQKYLPFKINIPLNSRVQYNGNAGTYADIERNGLWLLVISSVSLDANAPRVTYNARVTYYDS